jgi:hypothetical protein
LALTIVVTMTPPRPINKQKTEYLPMFARTFLALLIPVPPFTFRVLCPAHRANRNVANLGKPAPCFCQDARPLRASDALSDAPRLAPGGQGCRLRHLRAGEDRGIIM